MKLFYPRFALDAIRKNRRLYIPYMLTAAFSVTMYYILKSLSVSETLADTFGGSELILILDLGCWVIGIFSLIFLFYTGSFLIKQRKQEFGLYSVLGMEKRHIAKILFFETLLIALTGLAIGLALGAFLNWLSFLILLKMIDGDPTLPFSLSLEALGATVALFLVIFLLIYLNDLRQVQFSSAISLLKSGSEGEKEPRSRWPLTVLGLLFLAGGYGLALYIRNPVGAFMLFFVAVVLVMLGTYCLFISGSIVLLKLLKRNKRFYYRTNHFISVSGMLYRMKQNAVSLANICILSTMVLVTVSTTMCLYEGLDDVIEARYPRELNLKIMSDRETPELNALTDSVLEGMLSEYGVTAENEALCTYLSFSASQKGGSFSTDTDSATIMDELTSVVTITLTPLSIYNALTEGEKALTEGEILLYYDGRYGYDTFSVLEHTFTVKELLEDVPLEEIMRNETMPTFFLVTTDAMFYELNQYQAEVYGEYASSIVTYHGLDVGDAAAEQAISGALYDRICGAIDAAVLSDEYDWWYCQVESRTANQDSFWYLYGGMFFIGIFLGLVFLVATVLIIYYKQLSEGLQDQRRYTIMRQVGLTDREIRSSIHSQVLTVFFLPLLMAFVHTAFAFPMIQRILNVLSMSKATLFLLCTLCCCGVFTVCYLLIYLLTSRVYYRIVK